MKSLNDIEIFLLDMDGTIYLGDKLIDGADNFLRLLKKHGKSYIFLTNNSSKNRFEYVKKLNSLGIPASPDDIFTSGQATAIFLDKEKAGAKIFLLGTSALEDEFTQAGFELISESGKDIDYVVLGFDTTLTYQKLWTACDYIRGGIKYYATHPDINCPLEHGRFMPDAGAMIAFIKASTGKEPVVIGKPNAAMIDTLSEKYGVSKESMAIVGDRLYTDIKTGIVSGITSVLVLSGETTEEDYNFSEIRSDYIFPSVAEIDF